MLPTEYNDDLVQDFEIETQPTRTYALRFDGYPCSGGKLDGLEAMKQAIFLILQTERFQYAIYSWNYGIELNALLGQTMTPYLQAKVAKAIDVNFQPVFPSEIQLDPVIYIGDANPFPLRVRHQGVICHLKAFAVIRQFDNYILIFPPAGNLNLHHRAII